MLRLVSLDVVSAGPIFTITIGAILLVFLLVALVVVGTATLIRHFVKKRKNGEDEDKS